MDPLIERPIQPCTRCGKDRHVRTSGEFRDLAGAFAGRYEAVTPLVHCICPDGPVWERMIEANRQRPADEINACFAQGLQWWIEADRPRDFVLMAIKRRGVWQREV